MKFFWGGGGGHPVGNQLSFIWFPTLIMPVCPDTPEDGCDCPLDFAPDLKAGKLAAIISHRFRSFPSFHPHFPPHSSSVPASFSFCILPPARLSLVLLFLLKVCLSCILIMFDSGCSWYAVVSILINIGEARADVSQLCLQLCSWCVTLAVQLYSTVTDWSAHAEDIWTPTNHFNSIPGRILYTMSYFSIQFWCRSRIKGRSRNISIIDFRNLEYSSLYLSKDPDLTDSNLCSDRGHMNGIAGISLLISLNYDFTQTLLGFSQYTESFQLFKLSRKSFMVITMWIWCLSERGRRKMRSQIKDRNRKKKIEKDRRRDKHQRLLHWIRYRNALRF